MNTSNPNTNPLPEDRPRRTLAGIRVTAIVEIVLFLGAALAADQLFLDGSRFRSASQHPFWVPVLLVAVQYGTSAGLLAAVASSAALLIGNVPPQQISQDRFAYLLEITRLPLLWFVSAVLLGELRVRQINERAALRRRLAETSRREQVLADAYKRLSEAKEALETRVAGQLKTAVGIYETARAIEKLDPSEVLLGVASLVRSVMNPEQFSAYLLKNDRLELAVKQGWSEEDDLPRYYTASSELFQEIVGRQRLLSVANPDDARALSGAGIVAAPFVVPDSGRVIGMLKIEKLGFLDLNFSNLQILKVLCQWIGAAYNNALHYQKARSERVLNTETELFEYSYLSRQLSFLTVLAKRVGFDLTMIVVRLENPEELTHEQRSLVPKAFSQAASQALRKTDLAFDYQRTGTEFALILPAAPVKNADAVIRKLAASLYTELAQQAAAARFSFAVHAIHDMLQPAEENLELQSA